MLAWPSTQDVTNWGNGLAPNIKVDAANIKVKMREKVKVGLTVIGEIEEPA